MDPNSISAVFVEGAKHALVVGQGYAFDTLRLLLTLEVIWLCIELALAHPLESILAHFINLIMKWGFFYWLIANADTILAKIPAGFGWIGSQLSGVPNLNPMTVLATGTKLVETIWGAPTGAGLVSSFGIALGQMFACGWILLCFAIIGATALFLVIEAWLLIGGGGRLQTSDRDGAFCPQLWNTTDQHHHHHLRGAPAGSRVDRAVRR